MAIAILAGLVSSTMLNLFLVPPLTTGMEKMARGVAR
jgi:Cu/Ag efflux pump CusA